MAKLLKWIKHSIIILIVLSCVAKSSSPQSGSAATCSPDNIARCWSYFENSSLLTSVIPNATKEVLDDFCSRYDYFVRCYTPVREKCFNVISFSRLVIYDGERDSFGYMCLEGKTDYLANHNCFGDPNLQTECQTCKTSLTNQIERANLINDTIIKTNKFCQAGDLYLGCINNNLKVICSVKAAEWMMEFNRRSLYPLFSAFVCPGWEPTTMAPEQADDKLSIILGVCLTFFSLVILILTIIGIIYCLKTKCYENLSITPQFMKQKNRTCNPPPYLPTVSNSIDHQIPYKTEILHNYVKNQSEFDAWSISNNGYFTDDKSNDDQPNELTAEIISKNSPSTADYQSPTKKKKVPTATLR